METRKIKTKLIGKNEVFQLLALGEATSLPVLLLGEPGVGKTQTLLDYAASKYKYDKKLVREKTFVIELDEGTKTSEIKGRVNMKSLLEDKEYNVDAPIADAEFVLINEVDKGTSGVRNTLLSIMREKAIFYGNDIKKCKWQVFAGSCNVIPTDELENPFWDRFVLTGRVTRVGSDVMKNIWSNNGAINEIEINVPSRQDIENVSIKDTHMNKFLSVIYDAASDRTIYHIPFITKAVKLVYNISDVEAIIKTCDLLAPEKLGEISSKLETKKENNVRNLVATMRDVILAGNDAYSQLYVTQIKTALNEFNAMSNYKTKAKELVGEACEILNNVEGSVESSQFEALISELTSGLNSDLSERVRDTLNNTSFIVTEAEEVENERTDLPF